MSFSSMIKKISSDTRILGYVPMTAIPLTPRFVKRGEKAVLELFYLPVDQSQGRYTMYPARYRVLYDPESAFPVLMEKLEPKGDPEAAIGSYIRLMEAHGISADAAQKYAEICDKEMEKGTLSDEQIEKLFTLWEDTVPPEIKAVL